MKNKYVKTNWIDEKTPVNAANLGKIENALDDLYKNAPGKSQIIGDEKTVHADINDSGDVEISLLGTGLDVSESEEKMNPDKVTIVLDPETKKLKSIYYKGIKIYEVE